MVWSSGGQLREVFFRLHIRLDIQPPQLDNLRKHLVDGEGAELIKPFLRAVRDGGICMLWENEGWAMPVVEESYNPGTIWD